jgi:hypothetical protein
MSAEARKEHKQKQKGGEQSPRGAGADKGYDDYVPYKVYSNYTAEQRQQLREGRQGAASGSKPKKKRNGKPKQSGINSVGRDDKANDTDSDDGAKTPTNAAGEAFGPRNKKVRILDKIRSFDRRVMATARGAPVEEVTYCEGRVEIDNHADTHALGPNCRALSHARRTCTV